ncbi:Membrane protein [Desulfurella amilsii]|uniref:Membrane protein n=1 Tax=Desulfurella amilsii TaxID=1562698 RepID=A0A1X4XZZ5_9BACT|nr:flippase [Desulfurella amilsii]OSS43090.1 Membrane protein [Desulfurella amilsii]
MRLSEDKKLVFKNIFFLGLMQGANYILPFITIPYLVRTIGIEKYGLVAFAQSFAAYFVIFTDYGFSLSATKLISINRDNPQKISEIFSSVLFVKLVFVIFGIALSTIIIFSFKKFYSQYEIFYFSLLVLIGQMLFPVWLFQGLEKMKYITFINILIKLIFTLCIFIFIRQEKDYLYVPLINSLGFLVGGLVAFYIAIKQFNIKFTFNLINIKNQLIDGWHLFLAILSTNIYRNANTFFLGLVSTNTAVGYYALASKIIMSLQALMSPISQSLYPHLSKKYHSISRKNAIKNLFSIAKYYGLILFVIVFLVLIFSNFIIKIIAAKPMIEAVIDMRILSFVILFGSFNYLFGTIGLINLSFERYFTKSIVFVSIFDIIACLTLGYFFKDLGASIAFVASEFFLLLLVFGKILRIRNE